MGKSILTLRTALVAAGLASMLATTGLAVAQDKPHPPAAGSAGGALPAPRIIVVDRSAILRASKVGQDIVRQVNGLTQTAETQFRAENEGLVKESQTLQQQIAILAPDVRAQKIRAFQSKEAAFKQKVQTRQDQIQGGLLKARQQVEQALAPILQGIMQERGANLLLDRAAVVLGMVDVDVTKVTIQRLDQKLPSVKVQLVNSPPGLAQQMR
ncbi:MAG TPA: OmpH family outer membrane protein [Rhizomicrobium sp.]|jgi:outer membrane protein|nr:OmpH family outer membrane protein [Rhizomicrobium sp.]